MGAARGWQQLVGLGLPAARRRSAAHPADEAALAEVVRAAAEVRAVGAGHSFSPLVPTAGTLVSAGALSGLAAPRPANLAAPRCWPAPGSRRSGRCCTRSARPAQPGRHRPPIDRRRGRRPAPTAPASPWSRFRPRCAPCASRRPDGELLDCSPGQDAEVFAAARLSLGALGVLTRLELQNVPSYRLEEWIGVVPLAKVLAEMDTLKDRHRHVETWVFPYGKTAILEMARPHGQGARRRRSQRAHRTT